MELLPLVEEYRIYHAESKRLARTTLTNYTNLLRAFAKHTPPDPPLTVADLTVDRILSHLDRYTTQGAFRMNKYAIKHFLRWLGARKILSRDPLLGLKIEGPKTPRGVRRPIPDAVIERLLAACDRIPSTEYRRRLAKAALALFAFTGARRDEVVNIEVRDVHFAEGYISIRVAKGGQERDVHPCKECFDAIARFLEVRSPECRHPYLLAYSVLDRCAYNWVYAMLKRCVLIAGITEAESDGKVTPHRFRHSLAVRHFGNKTPIKVIQQELGHMHMQTTFVYLSGDKPDSSAFAEGGALKSKPVQLATPPRPVRIDVKDRKIRR